MANEKTYLLWLWSLAVYVFTFSVEAVGVATGAIFGEYAYGAGMKVQWLGVPLVIALNWTLLTLGVNDLASRLTVSPWLRAAAAALLIAAYDWFSEPVAIRLDYWQSATGSDIPLQNYIAWAVVIHGLIAIASLAHPVPALAAPAVFERAVVVFCADGLVGDVINWPRLHSMDNRCDGVC